jgi:hypothetical protein
MVFLSLLEITPTSGGCDVFSNAPFVTAIPAASLLRHMCVSPQKHEKKQGSVDLPIRVTLAG